MKLLIAEPPLQVLPSLAVRVGLSEAMVLQQLHYLLLKSKTGYVEKRLVEWVDGEYADFPFWEVNTVKRAFRKLRQLGVVAIEQPHGTDRRNRYRIDYDALERLVDSDPSKGTNCTLGAEQDAPLEEDNLDASNGSDRPHGTAQNVPLSNKGTAEVPATTEGESSAKAEDSPRTNDQRRTATPQGEVDRRALDKLDRELVPFVEPVLERLVDVAAGKAGAITPTKAAVARLLTAQRHKDYLPAADAFLHWALHGRGRGKAIRDVVASYRNWLSKEPDVLRKTLPPRAAARAERDRQVDETARRLREATQ